MPLKFKAKTTKCQNGASEISNWNSDIIELLMKLEAPTPIKSPMRTPMEVRDCLGNTWLHFAAKEGMLELVKLLIWSGAQKD